MNAATRAVPTHDRGSRGLSMVEVEHAAESLSAQRRAAYGCVVVCRGDELVAERLVRPLSVIVLHVLLNNLTQVAFAQRNHAIHTLAPN